MSESRRNFIKTAAVGGAGLVLAGAHVAARATEGTGGGSKPGKKLSVLVLGGTRFLGPALVERALERGHTVTLFNRGRSNPELFDKLEKLVGDRDPDKGAGLSALEGRTWDAVIDTSAYYPRMARASARLLAPNVKQYVVISTLSVYADTSEPGMNESAPVGTMDDPTLETMGDQFQYYGPLKALCEQAVEAAMPGRTTALRPGLIVGYRDNIPRFTYWPVRVERGGEILAPGNPTDPLQYVDVRDLARFAIHTIETGAVGTYNVNGPAEAPTNVAELLYGCKAVSGGDATFTWVDADFLAANQVMPWQHMPLWVPPTGESAGMHRMDCSKAVAAGFTTRPLAETVRETLQWFHEWPEDQPFRWGGGLEAEREKEVLAAWHARSAGKRPEKAAASGS